jgi:hypothetical protein
MIYTMAIEGITERVMADIIDDSNPGYALLGACYGKHDILADEIFKAIQLGATKQHIDIHKWIDIIRKSGCCEDNDSMTELIMKYDNNFPSLREVSEHIFSQIDDVIYCQNYVKITMYSGTKTCIIMSMYIMVIMLLVRWIYR